MVRKTEKSAKDKSPKATETTPGKKTECYEVSGRFEQDFTHMCRENSMPYCPLVKPLAQRPTTPWMSVPDNNALPTSSKKGKEEKKSAPTSTESYNTPADDLAQMLGFRPTTFTLTQTWEYFRPKVHIVLESSEKADTVTEVHIKGWKIDDTLLRILINCFTMASKLHTINLWRVGLTDEQVLQLVSFLEENNTVKRLHIDGNEPLLEDTLAQLIQDNGSVTKLRFRHCHLGPAEARQMALRLGTINTANTKLLSLDISGNQIGDEGALSFSQALRTNRTLLTLSLAQNNIGDVGCQALASVLSQYFLTHEEVVQRRILQSSHHIQESPPQSSRSLSSRRKSRVETGPKEQTRETNTGIGTKKKTSAGRLRGTKEAPAVDIFRAPAGSRTRDERLLGSGDSQKAPPTTTRGKPTRAVRSGKRPVESESSEIMLDMGETLSPLLEKAEYVEPHGLRVTGNFVLMMLNLARNRIGPLGIAALSEMVDFQQKRLTSSIKVNGTGLCKLIIQKL
ncbi:Leucine-rich repeat-containing protein 71 [Fasciola gigantica]|uniref:Leucine-rich repeat-containing protein 71 n=1 Tax=Fasciola gigantica TaxID=46835 RepID=A0A504YTZ2_FASGI|nr:Leucine-rich repeat-containing protein 71 [Fasciola gigantica]